MLNGSGLVLSGSQPTTITGPVSGVIINGNSQGTVFKINNTATLTGLTITGGSAGGILNTSSLTLADTIITGNSSDAGVGGGGLLNNGTASLTHVIVSKNSVTNFGGTGGGIQNFVSASLTLTDVTVSGNMCTTGAGGGIYNVGGTAILDDVTVSGNAAGGSGGGINNYGTMTLVNGTVAANSGASGGGIYNGGTLTVTNATITENRGGSGDGICNAHITTIDNSIIARNAGPAGVDVFGSFNSLGFNLVGQTSGSTGWNGSDITGVTDPRLGMLSNNGGPTETIALLSGSPAIDHGNNVPAVDANDNPLTTDQRGLPRISNGTVDIGAFEVQRLPPAVVVINDGSIQRSAVKTISLTFASPVALSSGALSFTRRNTGGSGSNDGSAPTDLSADVSFSNPSGDGMTWVVSFLPITGAADAAGGLADGIYDLVVHGAGVASTGGGSFADQTLTFHRLFGDIDGNGTVNSADYFQFKKAFGAASGSALYNAGFDFDNNGKINSADYFRFKANFGRKFTY
jgi:hypothetical protein